MMRFIRTRAVARDGGLEVEHHTHVRGGRARGRSEHRIQVELGDLREIGDQLRDVHDQGRERLAIHRFAPADAAQDLRGGDGIEHRERLLARRRRQAKGDVLQHLDQHSAETESHELAEGGIGHRADDHFLAAGEHLLHLHAIDRGIGLVAARVGDDGIEGLLRGLGALDADHDAPGLGLVQDLRRDDLHDDREADAACEAASAALAATPSFGIAIP
jgi:hypothetical protein